MLTRFITFLIMMLMPVIALAQTATSSPAIEELIKDAVEAGKGGAWPLVIGLGLMILTQLASKLKLLNWVPEGGKRWVVLGLAVAGSIGGGLVAGSHWSEILVQGLSVAAAAIGSFELFGRALSGGKKEPEA